MSSKSGKDLMGLSLRRAGDPCYPDYGTPKVMEDPGGKFIAKAIKRPGQLHRDLGVPQGQKIPAKKLKSAAKGNYGEKVEQRAHFAETLKKMH